MKSRWRRLERTKGAIYEYNDASWVTKIELRETATPANVLQRFEYGYDKVGNRLWSRYLNGRGDVYNYNANYQVIGVKYDVDDPTDGYALATGAARAVTYAYDAVGNRTSIVDGANRTTYAVNELNQYTSVGAVTPIYSAEGYLAEYGEWTHAYDLAGNLVEASKTGLTISYEYDARGWRVSRSDGTNTVFYVYNGLNLVEERDGTGTVLAEYIYDGLLVPRKAIIDGDEYYFQQDVLGNVTALTDDQGDVVESYTYDVYGMPEVRDGSGNLLSVSMTPFLFTGHYWDADTALYQARYRTYSPDLGRWLARDPIDFLGGDINLYGYVENMPTGFIDVNGLEHKKKKQSTGKLRGAKKDSHEKGKTGRPKGGARPGRTKPHFTPRSFATLALISALEGAYGADPGPGGYIAAVCRQINANQCLWECWCDEPEYVLVTPSRVVSDDEPTGRCKHIQRLLYESSFPGMARLKMGEDDSSFDMMSKSDSENSYEVLSFLVAMAIDPNIHSVFLNNYSTENE